MRSRTLRFLAVAGLATAFSSIHGPRVSAEEEATLPANFCGLVRDQGPEGNGPRPQPAEEADRVDPEALAWTESVPGMLHLLGHPNSRLRDLGLEHLPRWTAEAAALRPALVALLRHERLGVRCTAARGLGFLGPDAGARQALLGLLQGPVPVVEDAIWALGLVGLPGDEPLVERLLPLLSSQSIVVRNQVLETLAQLAPLSAQVQPRVAVVLPEIFPAAWKNDAGADVLLARLCDGHPVLLQEVMRTLLGGAEGQKRGAIRTLAQLAQPGPEVVRLLALQLKAESEVLRTEARAALRRMGALGQEMLRRAGG